MLQRDSEGRWRAEDGTYPVFLRYGSKGEDGVRRFTFTIHPAHDPQVIETDTDYAYLPGDLAPSFFERQWARTLTDDEAASLDATLAAEEAARLDAARLAAEEAAKNGQNPPVDGNGDPGAAIPPNASNTDAGGADAAPVKANASAKVK